MNSFTHPGYEPHPDAELWAAYAEALLSDRLDGAQVHYAGETSENSVYRWSFKILDDNSSCSVCLRGIARDGVLQPVATLHVSAHTTCEVRGAAHAQVQITIHSADSDAIAGAIGFAIQSVISTSSAISHW